MRHLILPVLLFGLASSAQAHEIWIEQDAIGPVRIYLGEPAEPVPLQGDPEFHRLKSPKLLGEAAPLVRSANHLAAAVTHQVDVRLVDDAVFEPWAGEDGKLEGAIFYARAGRMETIARLDFEIVPTSVEGDRFQVVYLGKPLPEAKVTIISPGRWSKVFAANEAGELTLPNMGAGRYLLTANHMVDGPRSLGGKVVAKVSLTSTLTVVEP